MPPHINVFNVVGMLCHEFPAFEIKLTDFTEAEVNAKNKIPDFWNRCDSICDMFNDEAEGILDFQQLVDEYNSENTDFGIV